MTPGTRVKVRRGASGSDGRFAGREGIVVEFDAKLPWSSPRALLCPEDFVCVHFMPKSAKERRDGSPMDLISASNLIASEVRL